MAYKAEKTVSPTSKLILSYLAGSSVPVSVISISDAVGASYWTVRILCKELAATGLLTLTLLGKSPYYSIAANKPEVGQ